MGFTVVDRPETLVAGAVLRSPALAVEGRRRRRVEEVWERTLERELPGPPATAYLDYVAELSSYRIHIVGYRCRTIDDLQEGDVLARIPAGKYAHFVGEGKYMGDNITSLWRTIWDAEADGKITRAYTGDFERYPDSRTVEVFVSLAKGSPQ